MTETSSNSFVVTVPDPCTTSAFTSQTIANSFGLTSTFSFTLPKLADTADTNYGASAGVCGPQSVTVTDSAGNDVSSWITPGDVSGTPKLDFTATNQPEGITNLIVKYKLDNFPSVTLDVPMSIYLCGLNTPNFFDDDTNKVTYAVTDQTYFLGDAAKSWFVEAVEISNSSPVTCASTFSISTPVITETPACTPLTDTQQSGTKFTVAQTSATSDMGTYAVTVS
jgi:hypothetical protein